MDEKIVEVVARALEPVAWAALGLCDTLTYGSVRKSSLRRARAAIEAHTAALAEEGIVIAKKQEPQPKETFAEEVARLQREIGQRQLRLQYLVCGDPCIMVTVPTTAALDQR